MTTGRDPDDPKGLIRESYNIDGITTDECRSILVDWALSLPVDADAPAAATRLLRRDRAADHPMTALLHEAAGAQPGTRRRGGRAARVGNAGHG